MEPIPGKVAWKSPQLLMVHASRAALTASLGEPHERDVDSHGVGLFDLWTFRCSCGLELAITLPHHRPGSWELLPDANEPAIVTIYANERDAAHILFHLPVVGSTSVAWTSDECVEGARGWVVTRQDDNGNRCDVDAFTSKCEAEAVAQTFEKRGHKQLYSVEQR